MIGPIVYALCASTSLICFVLLLRSYLKTRVKLLFWSATCFFFLTAQNVIVIFDMLIFKQIDLSFWRTLAGFLGCFIFLIALIRENR